MLKKTKKYWAYYLMLSIPFILLILFSYLPMLGVITAFKEYTPRLGILDSPWNDFKHFKRMFNDFAFRRAFRNTFVIGLLKVLIVFPFPVILALLLDQVKKREVRYIFQTVLAIPYLISWVVASAMILEIFSPQDGLVNEIINFFGGQRIHFMADNFWFIVILTVTDIWKNAGFDAIVYSAAISGISRDIYDAAEIDGANQWYQTFSITLPLIMPVVITLFIIRIGNLLNGNFDQVFNLYNPSVYEWGDIIDTYVYRTGLVNLKFDYGTAIGLLRNILSIFMVFLANIFVKKVSAKNMLE